MSSFLLGLAAFIAVAAAVGVVFSKEAVHSALYLTVHLLGIGALFLFLTHQFLAVAQLLVYAGAVMVVFMFAVTTLSPREEPLALFGDGGLPLMGLVTGAGVFVTLIAAFVRSGVAERKAPDHDFLVPIQAFAFELFGPFLLPFEGTAFLLLVALIGAVLLGGRRQLGDG